MSKEGRMSTEVDIAAVVVAWLHDLRWDVYQEVEAYGHIADIVAVHGSLLWIVEVKTGMGLRVMDQAWAWRRRAHLVSVATPRSRRSSPYARYCLDRDGIGVLEVSMSTDLPDAERVKEVGRGALNRCPAGSLRSYLHDEQKTHCPAGSQAGRWTPFQNTCQELRRYVLDHPGTTLKAAVDEIKHHYLLHSTARSSLAKLIRDGVVKGVRCEQIGRAILLFPDQLALPL